MPLTWKRAIIIGASSGIGESLAKQLVQGGCQVACVSRRGTAPEGGTAYTHDVESIAEVPALFETIVRDLGGVDLVVYASGVMPRVGTNEYDTAKDRETIAVNFTGAVAWLNEAAQRFEKAKTGTIVGISSVAGDRGRRGNPVYGATKAAFNAYLESLYNRLTVQGATVVTIKPGPVATAMTQGLKMPLMISSDQAATEIMDAASAGVRLAYVPAKWKPIMAVIKTVPATLFRYLNI